MPNTENENSLYFVETSQKDIEEINKTAYNICLNAEQQHAIFQNWLATYVSAYIAQKALFDESMKNNWVSIINKS